VSLIASFVLLALAVLPLPASAWNIPGHMLSGIIAYQILEQEHLGTIEKVRAVLEKHPWSILSFVLDANIVGPPCRLHEQDHVAVGEGNVLNPRLPLVCVPRWHYINFPFKPEGQPASVQARDPDRVNILTATEDNCCEI